MPFPLGNRWRLGFNASAFSCAFLGAVGRSLKPFPPLKSVGEPLGIAPTEPSAWVWRDRVQGQSFLATQTPSTGSTSLTIRLKIMSWTVVLHLCGASAALSWYLFWQPTTQQARPECTGRAGSGGGRTPWFCACCLQLRRFVLTRATGRDAAFFEAGLNRYRLVDMLICTTTLSVCHELFNHAWRGSRRYRK